MNVDHLEHLKERFARVSYRPEIEKYEIGGLVLLSIAEASAVVAGELTLEQVVMRRNTPPHLWRNDQQPSFGPTQLHRRRDRVRDMYLPVSLNFSAPPRPTASAPCPHGQSDYNTTCLQNASYFRKPDALHGFIKMREHRKTVDYDDVV